jgi:hypothetical protein
MILMHHIIKLKQFKRNNPEFNMDYIGGYDVRIAKNLSDMFNASKSSLG